MKIGKKLSKVKVAKAVPSKQQQDEAVRNRRIERAFAELRDCGVMIDSIDWHEAAQELTHFNLHFSCYPSFPQTCLYQEHYGQSISKSMLFMQHEDAATVLADKPLFEPHPVQYNLETGGFAPIGDIAKDIVGKMSKKFSPVLAKIEGHPVTAEDLKIGDLLNPDAAKLVTDMELGEVEGPPDITYGEPVITKKEGKTFATPPWESDD